MFSFLTMVQKFGFGVELKVIEVNEEREWNLQEIFEIVNVVEQPVFYRSVRVYSFIFYGLANGTDHSVPDDRIIDG